MLFKGRISKLKFEVKLGRHFDELSIRQYTEDGRRMNLYYDNGTHVGTWMGGEAWIFSLAKIAHSRELTKKMMEVKDEDAQD